MSNYLYFVIMIIINIITVTFERWNIRRSRLKVITTVIQFFNSLFWTLRFVVNRQTGFFSFSKGESKVYLYRLFIENENLSTPKESQTFY